MPTEDPLRASSFALEFQGVIAGVFRECSGLGSENSIITQEGRNEKGQYIVQKLPGNIKWTDIVLKSGVTSSLKMWDWRKLVEEGKVEQARKNGALVMYNSEGNEIARWELIRCWPSKLTGPSMDAKSGEVAIEELTVTHEGYKRSK
jgi:phage tail-like protein